MIHNAHLDQRRIQENIKSVHHAIEEGWFNHAFLSLFRLGISPDLALAESVLLKGAAIDAADSQGYTALHLAVSDSRIAIQATRFLIDHHANLEARNHIGETPLHRACWMSLKDHAALLIEAGANIHTPSGSGLTPLHLAVTRNATDICQMLIDKGADINSTNQFAETPLRQAANYDRTEVAELLIANGAYIEPDLISRYPFFELYHEEAKSRLRDWEFDEKADVTRLTARDLLYFSNIGKLDAVLTRTLWQGHHDHLLSIISDLPPCFLKNGIALPALVNALFQNPSPLIGEWSATTQLLATPKRGAA